MQRSRIRSKRGKAGFGLLEVMIAALILAILVLGGSATMYLTSSNIRNQGHKRIALQLADQRLEIARNNYYYSIAPAKNDGSPEYDVDNKYYLTENSSDAALLDLNDSLESEDVSIGGFSYEIITKVLRHSADYGTIGFDPEALEVTVTVEYNPSTGESVELSTLLLPPQVTL